MTNSTLGISQCSTCGRRKPHRKFPRNPTGGTAATCLQCLQRTETLAERAERLRTPSASGFPPAPLQVEVRRRLEHSTQIDLCRRLQCGTHNLRALLDRRKYLDLSEADRWAHRLDSHLDLIWSA